MSKPYAVAFVLLGGCCALLGVVCAVATSGASLVLLDPAVSFGVVAVAYARGGARLLGKTPDGRRRFTATCLLAPYLTLTRFSFALYRLFARASAVCEIVPGMFLGRRLVAGEAGAVAGAAVLDLAAEFSEVRPLREGRRYLSMPLLDATAPTPEQLERVVGWVTDRLAEGPVFVHCALGHGRSACVVLGCLLRWGVVPSIRDGLRLVRERRPGVGLYPAQRELLRAWEGRFPPARP
jgi:hypothetical protein